MTKKDYEQLVRILRRCRTDSHEGRYAYFHTLVNQIEEWLTHDNEQFNSERFKIAVYKTDDE